MRRWREGFVSAVWVSVCAAVRSAMKRCSDYLILSNHFALWMAQASLCVHSVFLEDQPRPSCCVLAFCDKTRQVFDSSCLPISFQKTIDDVSVPVGRQKTFL